MTKITHDNAASELLRKIPELSAFRQFDEDELSSPTIVFDTFGDFILDHILHSTEDDVIKRCFDFINEMQESDDPDVQNLPQIGVFEVLAGSKKGIEVADKHLSKNGKEWFDKIKQNFNPE